MALNAAETRGQTRSVSGTVLRESNQNPVYRAQVIVVSRKDSLLLVFGRTNSSGQFQLSIPDSTPAWIQISYPGILSYFDTIDGNKSNVDLGKITMLDKFQLLQAAVVKGYTDGIKLNGDTTEYLADFFKTNPGATVEDLLKKLPGIQVTKNGEIKAQGKTIKKILVDGEEFFSDDPGIATKYLRADMIDKVQVYDENVDTLKGKTGDETRIMNLTMKEGKNKGLFGKLEAGSNFSEYSNAGAFAGYFNQKLKTAVYGKTSNFENSSLNWDERRQYGSAASGGEVVSNGMYSYSNSSNSFNDQLDSRGIPGNTSTGAVLNYKFSDKLKINASYRLSDERLAGEIIRKSDYFLPDTAYSLFDTTKNVYAQLGQRLNVNLTLAPDSSQSITVEASAGLNRGNSISKVKSKTSSVKDINDNTRELGKSYSREMYNISARYAKNYRKPGRNLTISTSGGYNPAVSEQSLLGETRFFSELGSIKNKTTTNQLSEIQNSSRNGNVSITFIEPRSKALTFTFYVNSTVNFNTNATNTFNTILAKERVDSLSNNFAFQSNLHNASMGLNYKLKDISFWGMLGAGISNYTQNNKFLDTTLKQNFFNLLPSAGINYSWKPQTGFQLSYNGRNQAPSFSALQPVVNNSDLLNRSVGNPNLVQSFYHNITANINSYKTLKGRYLWGYLNFSLPRNAFVSSTQIDSFGIRRTLTVNANGNYNFSSSVDYTIKLKKLPIYLGVGGGMQRSKMISFNNGQKIETISNSPNANASFSISTDNFEFDLEYDVSYNTNQSGLSNNVYFIHTPSYEIEISLPYNFTINTSGDLSIRPATALFNQRNVYYLRAYLSKTFGKNNNFEASFFMNDLLNQNIGFNRFISTNLLTEEVYTQLSRYWLIKLRWNFNTTGGKK